MGEAGDATDVYLRAFFTILKPGGILAVEQHRAPKGADPRAGTGYVPESYVIDAARKAGFTLDAKSKVNANPLDTKDYPFGVWTLPPTHRSAPSGEPPNPNFDHCQIRRHRRIGPHDAQIPQAGVRRARRSSSTRRSAYGGSLLPLYRAASM